MFYIKSLQNRNFRKRKNCFLEEIIKDIGNRGVGYRKLAELWLVIFWPIMKIECRLCKRESD